MHRKWISRLVIAVFCAASLAPALASAEEPEHKGFGGLGFSFFTKETGATTTTHFGTKVSAAYKVLPQVVVSLDWGLPWTSVDASAVDGGNISDFGIGNPYVAAQYLLMHGHGLHVGAGLGFGLPIATVPTDDLEAGLSRAVNLETAIATAGLQGAWLYLPDTFSVVVPVHASAEFKSGLEVGGELAFAVFIPTGDPPAGAPDEEIDMAFECALDAAYKVAMVAPGVRFALTYEIPGGEADPAVEEDYLQMIVEPFVKLDLGKAFGRIGFMMALDNPLGWAFNDPDPAAPSEDGPGVWSLNLAGGTYF